MTARSAEDADFRPDKPAAAKADTSPTVQAEVQQFAVTATPNTVFLSFGRLGHISWHSESSTAVLGLIVLLLLCLLTLLITLSALFTGDRSWLPIIIQALGSAIAGVAGAIVGASVSASGHRRRRG
jgi:uncharacterized integral membrane protein